MLYSDMIAFTCFVNDVVLSRAAPPKFAGRSGMFSRWPPKSERVDGNVNVSGGRMTLSEDHYSIQCFECPSSNGDVYRLGSVYHAVGTHCVIDTRTTVSGHRKQQRTHRTEIMHEIQELMNFKYFMHLYLSFKHPQIEYSFPWPAPAHLDGLSSSSSRRR